MKTCPFCGTENRDNESFCEQCGGFLGPTTVTGTPGESAPMSNSQPSNTQPLLLPGSQLQSGRYVIKKILGQGGMGSLALANDTRLADKLVVIKELVADQADLAEDVRNFRHEVQTLAHRDHPLVPGA